MDFTARNCSKLAGLFAAASAAAPKLTKPHRWRAYYWRINNILSLLLLLLHWFTRVVNGPATIWPISGCFNVCGPALSFSFCVNSALGTNYVLACSSWRAPGSLSQCHLFLSLCRWQNRIVVYYSVYKTRSCLSLSVSLFGACWQQQQWPTTTTSLWDSVSVSNWNWWRNRFAADSPLKSTTLVCLLGNGMERGEGRQIGKLSISIWPYTSAAAVAVGKLNFNHVPASQRNWSSVFSWAVFETGRQASFCCCWFPCSCMPTVYTYLADDSVTSKFLSHLCCKEEAEPFAFSFPFRT